jgi:hypothetical protein
MRRFNRTVFTAIGFIVSFGVQSQSYDTLAVKYASFIQQNELKELLYVLASDEMEGRETAMPGQKKAAQFIADYYQGAGIAPIVKDKSGALSYYQDVPLRLESMKNCEIWVKGKRYSFIKDFYRFPGYLPEELLLNEVVFVGYGIENDRYNDYAGISVAGKVVLMLSDEPIGKSGLSHATGKPGTTDWSDFKKKKDLAVSKGALGVIYVNSSFDTYVTRILMFLERKRMVLDRQRADNEEAMMAPIVFVSPNLAKSMLKAGKKKSPQAYAKKIKKTGQPHSLYFQVPGGKILLRTDEEKTSTENILAYIEGSDPILKKELVVISAHYDHIGRNGAEINNGADDDGSGTVAAMVIAKAFQRAKQNGQGPKRSVLILNVSGEEKGLLGSEWYTDFPVFPLENTICNLNIDMIGRMDEFAEGNPDYIYIIGSDFLSTELHELSVRSRDLYSDLKLDYRYNDPKEPNRFYYRSDHYNFAKNGIPSIFYFSGVHEDYHRPTDTADKILYDKLEKVTKLIFFTAWNAANRPNRFAVDVSIGE